MKKFKTILLSSILIIFLASCSSNSAEKSNSAKSTSSEETAVSSTEQEKTKEKVKSDGYEKFSQLKLGMTEDEVNTILGEPTSVDKAYYYYNVTVNQKDMELTVWINMESGLVTYISGDFNGNDYRAEFADSAVDLSKAKNLENGEIKTYEDCVSTFKTDGSLISIDEKDEKRYLWVNEEEGYMVVTIKADGSVKTYGGFC